MNDEPAKTCLILGAGASKPYGYPLGEELAQKIIACGMEGRNNWAEPGGLREAKSRAITVASRFAKCRIAKPNMTVDEFLGCEYHEVEKRPNPGAPEWEEYSMAKV